MKDLIFLLYQFGYLGSYLGVEALDPVSVSLLQQRLNDLGAGIKIEMY